MAWQVKNFANCVGSHDTHCFVHMFLIFNDLQIAKKQIDFCFPPNDGRVNILIVLCEPAIAYAGCKSLIYNTDQARQALAQNLPLQCLAGLLVQAARSFA